MLNYLSHLLQAKGPDRVHSPFVFDLYFHTLRCKYHHPCFSHFEKKFKTSTGSNKAIIDQSIFRIVNRLKPDNVLILSNTPLKVAHYISVARKKTHIDLLVTVTQKINSLLDQSQSICAISSHKIKNSYDLIILDLDYDYLTDHLITIQNSPIVIFHNKNTKRCTDSQIKLINKVLPHNITLNFFHFGMLFNRKEQKKEYFRLRL